MTVGDAKSLALTGNRTYVTLFWRRITRCVEGETTTGVVTTPLSMGLLQIALDYLNHKSHQILCRLNALVDSRL